MKFRGGPVLTLDAKGRLTVPSRWRDALMESVQGQMVVAKNADGCLGLYPMPVWEQLEAHLLALPSEHDAWRRFFIGSATEVDIDAASRVLIPPELRTWAKLDREVKFMGVGSYFELWDIAKYAEREAEAVAVGRPDVLRNLVLQ
ncbi:MAG: division/cell wall cluster transcriptional repressor MraZ [Burkholderiales bacterium]|nr:division/cell wall cluster transcriptional repressor MraZ [Burkholderiales bacterium]